ncbi:hypothetical protein ANN_23769 [Periplaneta americana]|uniref:Uncharacterized protein n=1 Tax=Periplaneta americana TaxID=6978 RepID=A0ABQ8SM04_PERAM|nr:hypothetical protein ANN_23769 [Periplaneta americana]
MKREPDIRPAKATSLTKAQGEHHEATSAKCCGGSVCSTIQVLLKKVCSYDSVSEEATPCVEAPHALINILNRFTMFIILHDNATELKSPFRGKCFHTREDVANIVRRELQRLDNVEADVIHMKKAPKSAAERMREYRARMDTEKTQERLEKCRNIMRKLRKKPKSKSEKSPEREATRKRVQEYRRGQKARVLSSCILKDSSSGSPPYKGANSFGKAIKRAQRNLPRSPRKQTAVVRKLAESFNLLVQPAKHSTSSTLSITADTMKMVKDFYE